MAFTACVYTLAEVAPQKAELAFKIIFAAAAITDILILGRILSALQNYPN
jgi:hypothetical protein